MISFGRWQFDLNEPLVIGLCLFLLASMLLSFYMVAKRLFKRSPLRAMAVMLLNLVAYGVIFLLVLEPRFSQATQQSVTLITEGAEIPDLSGMSSANLYVAPGVPASSDVKQKLPGANWLLDAEQLPLREPALSGIKVHGFGLEPDQWLAFPQTIQIEFEPADVIGFTAMRWSRSLSEGDTLRISGHYQSAGHEAIIQLRLLDPADNLVDEGRIKNNQGFSLSTRIRAPGNLTYKLQAWHAERMLSQQTVPVEVGTGSLLNIMIKQSAPSFETRALKNYAASQGHRVHLSSDISKGKSITQIANLPAETDNNLSPQNLAMQDLLVMDGRALVNLPATHKQWLNEAIENGLGLLVLADSALSEKTRELDTELLNGFHIAPLPGAETSVVPRSLTADIKGWQEPVTVAAMQLNAENANILIDDGQGRSLVVTRQKGLGVIGISLISHSHNWLTAGQDAHWGQYWRTLFSNLARQRRDSYLLAQTETAFSRVNHRTAVCAHGIEESASVTVSALTALEQPAILELQLATDLMKSPRQCVYFWPNVNGWHRLQLYSVDSDSVLDQKAIYVFSADQWLPQHRSQRLQATMNRTVNSKNLSAEPALTSVYEPLNPFWLWLTLIFSASCLWLERKLDFAQAI